MDLMFKQIKGKLELDDEQVQNSKIMGVRNLWVKQISCVINRTASRNIMSGRAALVEAVNASSKDDRTSTQRDDQLAANSTVTTNYISISISIRATSDICEKPRLYISHIKLVSEV